MAAQQRRVSARSEVARQPHNAASSQREFDISAHKWRKYVFNFLVVGTVKEDTLTRTFLLYSPVSPSLPTFTDQCIVGS